MEVNVPKKKRGRKPKKKPVEENIQAEQTETSSSAVKCDETSNSSVSLETGDVEKIKSQNSLEITTDIIPPKKKRGRKPKPKPANEEVKMPKKRGRKPKEIFKPPETSNMQISEEAVILHLNIKNNSESILNIEDEFVKYNPSINIPVPFIPEDLDTAFYLKNTNSVNELTNNLNTLDEVNNSNNMSEINNTEDENIIENLHLTNQDHSSLINNSNIDLNNEFNMSVSKKEELEEKFKTENLKMNINIQEKIVDTDKKPIEYTEETISDKNKCLPIFMEYSDANRKNTWPQKTNIDCFWCCCAFDNTPFGIPIKKVDEKFLMFGNFCSAECAASHIFDINFLNDNEKTESYSMLNYIYKEKDSKGIQFAPSKLCLKRFGGRLTIEQYRANLRSQNKMYDIIIPPLTSIIPNIEETNVAKSINDIKVSNFNNSIVSRSGELLRLRRQKPLPDSNNTLEACMNLKFV